LHLWLLSRGVPQVAPVAIHIQPLSGLAYVPQVAPVAIHIQPLSGLACYCFVFHSSGKCYINSFIRAILDSNIWLYALLQHQDTQKAEL